MNATHARLARRTFFLALLLPVAAHATPWNAGNHGNNRTEGIGQGPYLNDPQTTISQHDIAVIQDYYRAQAPAGGAPPPGTQRLWTAGHALPAGAPAEPLPPDLNARVSPFYGFHYVRLGGDILMVEDSTRVVTAAMPILLR